MTEFILRFLIAGLATVLLSRFVDRVAPDLDGTDHTVALIALIGGVFGLAYAVKAAGFA